MTGPSLRDARIPALVRFVFAMTASRPAASIDPLASVKQLPVGPEADLELQRHQSTVDGCTFVQPRHMKGMVKAAKTVPEFLEQPPIKDTVGAMLEQVASENPDVPAPEEPLRDHGHRETLSCVMFGTGSSQDLFAKPLSLFCCMLTH
eukprot:7773013-Alexandrium_andersonii.AAC.1